MGNAVLWPVSAQVSRRAYYTGLGSVTAAAPSFALLIWHFLPVPQEQEVDTKTAEESISITAPANEEGLGRMLKRTRYTYRVPGGAGDDVARLEDLADCLPRQEACEVLCAAGLRDLMRLYHPLTHAAPCTASTRDRGNRHTGLQPGAVPLLLLPPHIAVIFLTRRLWPVLLTCPIGALHQPQQPACAPSRGNHHCCLPVLWHLCTSLCILQIQRTR